MKDNCEVVNVNESMLGFAYELKGMMYGSYEANTYLAGDEVFRVDVLEIFKLSMWSYNHRNTHLTYNYRWLILLTLDLLI